MSLSPESFALVADVVRRRSAIQLAPGKEYLVESRLGPLARAAGTDLDTWLAPLRTGRPDLVEAVVEALTTNETSWFRDAEPFRMLVEHVVPETQALPGALPGVLRVWSAACSTGQEPYSVAMALAERTPHVRPRILATDLSEQVLARARTGRYSQLEVNRGLPATTLVRYLTRAGADWEVAPQIRQTVVFQRHNLLDTPPLGGPFDVVLLRNVLIYFDLATKREVLTRVRRVLRPGGFLLLGAAETTIGVDDTWERVVVGRGSVYRPMPRRAA